MAKILVADDNSNIQRMVGLALKDQGIDVVAVGNGEAAVRKISELRPDLVLADVFMPVRNGYEVCEYVKKDASLAHIPVILLVGAFDPLDEQEAQRVGADGVLKKPFVPPDPLIAMVKAALQRAGISLAPAGAEKPPAAPPRKAADLLQRAFPTPPPPKPISPLAGVAFSGSSSGAVAPASSASNTAVAEGPMVPMVGDESFVDEPPAPQAVSSESASHTMAFGNLLESPAAEDAGGDVETARGSDWRALDEPDDVPEEEEEAAATPPAPSWRREENGSAFANEDGSGAVKDWRDSPELQTAGRKSAIETWEQAEEKGGFVSAAEVPTEMGEFATELSALEGEAQASNSQEARPTESAASQTLHPDQSAGPDTSSGEAGAIAVEEAATTGTAEVLEMAATDERAAHEQSEFADAPGAEQSAEQKIAEVSPEAPIENGEPASGDQARAHEVTLAEEPAAASDSAQAAEAVHQAEPAAERGEEKIPEPSTINNWFSRPVSPWDTDTQKVHPLAAAWDAGGHPKGGNEAGAAQNANGQASAEEIATVVSDDPGAHGYAGGSGHAGSMSDRDMDALVARVLAKISPEVLQAVTREILKPVISAILEDELKQKR